MIMDELDVKSLYEPVMTHKTISTSQYKDRFVDLKSTSEACSNCPMHNNNWACPDFQNDELESWDKYDNLDLYFVKINFTKEAQKTKYTMDQLQYITDNTLFHERNKLIDKLEILEIEKDGCLLSAGYCGVCDECSKINNKPCRYPDKCHFSIESIGGLVPDTLKDVFDEEIKWIDTDNGYLPENLSLLMGLLY